VRDEEGFDLETQKRILAALSQPFDEKEDMVFSSADELLAYLRNDLANPEEFKAHDIEVISLDALDSATRKQITESRANYAA
jgi:hypothetical protein